MTSPNEPPGKSGSQADRGPPRDPSRPIPPPSTSRDPSTPKARDTSAQHQTGQPTRPRSNAIASSPLATSTIPGTVASGSLSGQPAERLKLVQKAFRVIKKVKPDDVERLNRTVNFGFMVVEVGDFGIIPFIPPNRDPKGGLVQYPVVKVYHHTKHGPEPLQRSPLGQGKCFVPLSHIEIGAVCTHDLGVVGEVVPVRLPPVLRKSGIGVSPLRTFLETFLASVTTIEGKEFLLSHAVHIRVIGSLDKDASQQSFVRALLEGKFGSHRRATEELSSKT
ncbi:hypothetical protein NW768_007077 [Fusarium equiseti]|uniref:Uncharacterized protein n=1 Tax=Fusarium equiseti TaxID=61235 RepID=A0ABQ8RA46_FUSEQ|nr:hypothetical protein NW768_007077 [Fusarium equiseti]